MDHRPGPLKQKNKAHKSVHSTKRSIDRVVKGRVETRVPTKVADRAAVHAAGRAARVNRNKQVREQRKMAQAVERRLGPGMRYCKMSMCKGVQATLVAL